MLADCIPSPRLSRLLLPGPPLPFQPLILPKPSPSTTDLRSHTVGSPELLMKRAPASLPLLPNPLPSNLRTPPSSVHSDVLLGRHWHSVWREGGWLCDEHERGGVSEEEGRHPVGVPSTPATEVACHACRDEGGDAQEETYCDDGGCDDGNCSSDAVQVRVAALISVDDAPTFKVERASVAGLTAPLTRPVDVDAAHVVGGLPPGVVHVDVPPATELVGPALGDEHGGEGAALVAGCALVTPGTAPVHILRDATRRPTARGRGERRTCAGDQQEEEEKRSVGPHHSGR